MNNIEGIVGLGILLLVQLGHLFKSLSNDKVITAEIKNLKDQVVRQNSSISKNTDRINEHIEKCHSK